MQRPIFLFFTATLVLVASMPASAQKFMPKTIQFKGDPEYSDQELMAAAGIKKGIVLNSDEMNEHSKRLMDSGVFDTLKFTFNGQDLIFTLTPSTALFPLRLENLPLTPGKELDVKLRDRFPLYHGKVPSEGSLLEEVRGALEEMLASQGIKAAVTAMPYTDRKLQKVTAMSFSITALPVEVGEIHIDSTSASLDPQAQDILVKQSGSTYDAEGSPNQIETNLANFYRDKGYLEAEINATPQFPATATAAAIQVPFLIAVTPGTLYKLSGVQLAPGLLVTQTDFDKQSHIHPGDVATSQYVRENWEFLARQYHNKGYMKAVVNPTPSFDRTHGTVSFSVTVDPGSVYTMGTLRIDNVSDDLRTRMVAAWKLPAGAVFNESAIRNFYAIGDANPMLKRVFAAVNCKYVITLNDDTHTADVVLRLEKRP
jgi:outer membrane protein insertion porin family